MVIPGGFLTIELRIASYLSLFMAKVASCVLDTSYELQIITRRTSYFLHTSYELLFFHELRVTFKYEVETTIHCTNYELLFTCK